jgi:hypothetical protein
MLSQGFIERDRKAQTENRTMSESDIQARILLAIGALPGVRVFRNHVGEGWHGQVLDQSPDRLLLAHPRRVTFGLAPGSSDIIGWRTVTIRPEDVGRQIAQFVGHEVKTTTGVAAEKQRKFHAALSAAGGLSAVVRSPERALHSITERW